VYCVVPNFNYIEYIKLSIKGKIKRLKCVTDCAVYCNGSEREIIMAIKNMVPQLYNSQRNFT